MKTILVTGGAGFIGSNLCRELLKDSENIVICLDNLYTGKEDNIHDLLTLKNFTFVNHDITNPFDIVCDQTYNLACPASPLHYQKDPLYTWKCSVFGIWNVLMNAQKHHSRVVQASTSEIYGDPEVHPQPEEYWGHVNPIGPRSCYDEGKRAAETACVDFRRQQNVDIRIARIFNTYGQHMALDDGRVISNFIVQALRNEPITVYGDGSQTRSFCYVTDLICGLMLLMNHPTCTGPINIGNPDEYTIKEFAEKIISLTGSSSQIIFNPLPQDDPRQRRPDITLARHELRWEPTIPLVDGLKKTIAYFKSTI